MNENKNVVFSGFSDDTLSEKILSKGYSISNVTRKNTVCVIVADPYKSYGTSSAKVKIALQLNIPIISHELLDSYII